MAEEPAELLGHPVLLALLQLQQDMFLGREVEEEGAVRDAGGGHDGADIGLGHPGPLELGDGGAHQPLPRLQALRLARRGPVRHRHVRLCCRTYQLPQE